MLVAEGTAEFSPDDNTRSTLYYREKVRGEKEGDTRTRKKKLLLPLTTTCHHRTAAVHTHIPIEEKTTLFSIWWWAFGVGEVEWIPRRAPEKEHGERKREKELSHDVCTHWSAPVTMHFVNTNKCWTYGRARRQTRAVYRRTQRVFIFYFWRKMVSTQEMERDL